MGAVLAAALTLVLVGATVLIHYQVLGAILRLVPHLSNSPRINILVVIGGIFIAHLIEIWLFALAYFLMDGRFGIGFIAGEISGSWIDFFYFSASTYTTLGVGDVIPHGPLRIIAGIESLIGLVLIGWSASFTYLMMQNAWNRRDGPTAPT